MHKRPYDEQLRRHTECSGWCNDHKRQHIGDEERSVIEVSIKGTVMPGNYFGYRPGSQRPEGFQILEGVLRRPDMTGPDSFYVRCRPVNGDPPCDLPLVGTDSFLLPVLVENARFGNYAGSRMWQVDPAVESA
mgnify:FL=1